METGDSTVEARRVLVPTVARLVEFLRDLATAGRPRVLDVAAAGAYPDQHERVLWLAELPVEAVPFGDAGPR